MAVANPQIMNNEHQADVDKLRKNIYSTEVRWYCARNDIIRLNSDRLHYNFEITYWAYYGKCITSLE